MTCPAEAGRRIVFVSHTDAVSGAERVLIALATEALADGRQVVVACPTGVLSAQLPANIRHIPIPKLGFSAASGIDRYFAMVRLLMNWVRAAVILRPLTTDSHTSVIVNSLFALPALRLTLRKRCCAWLVHDTVTMRKQRMVVRFSGPAIRRAVAVSHTTARQLEDFDFPVLVSFNGVHLKAEPADIATLERPVVGILAKLTPWKGHRVALEAMRLVPGVDLEMAGDHFPGEDDYVGELRCTANDPELIGRVRFLGHADSTQCLGRWTALISPSVGPEAGPLGILEAMSAGVPVIATDHGGSAEYLDGDVGLLVTPGDPKALAEAITSLISEPGLRRVMAQRGREKVARLHDVTVTVPRMLRLLTED
ncbi:glycosyltransferase family 4 protein [Mycolicibacterium komossense]|uniref:Glycosyltransferase family 4 protein n=1 Tax=Mycolicibacterium komossense TaxID=1779 RepID=A0ABT3CCE5_9MYCO|nr:glycosyltransferase family 4 protein [Mycolicibacterium komossense]MCV7227169.1 glycosyltransferase family 4 protein [Mycolicibacterium komossense]